MNVQRPTNHVNPILPAFVHYLSVAGRGVDGPPPSLECRVVSGGPSDQLAQLAHLLEDPDLSFDSLGT